jgi:hypothetical protein
MSSRTQQILDLSPRQALAVMQYMTVYLADQRVDNQDLEPDQQIEVINAALEKAGYPPVLSSTIEASERGAGQAAQQFLMWLAKSTDAQLLSELDGWLAEPPEAAIASIPLVLALPIVLTGCIVALQTSVSIKYTETKTWTIQIEKDSMEGETLTDIAGGLFNTIKSLPDYP